jgi:hypothetical protein
MDSISHIVRREFVDLLVVGSEVDGFALQRKLGELCGGLTNALDDAFAQSVPRDEHWFLERLEVDAGCFTPATFERDFVHAVAQAVGARIRACAGSSASRDEAGPGVVRRVTGPQSVHAAWLHFLATGALPWWFRLSPGQSLEQAVGASWRETPPGAGSFAFIELMRAPAARTRLQQQFSAAFVDALFERISPPAASALQTLLVEAARRVDARSTLTRVSAQLRDAALDMLSSRRMVTVETLLAQWAQSTYRDNHAGSGDERMAARRAFADIALALDVTTGDSALPEPDGDARPAPTSEASDTSHTRVDAEDALFIDCAGIVLLHPFLPALFERLGVAADGALVQPDRALALLHFLATGATSAPEYALVLPKLLCGLPVDALSGPPVELTDAETTEASDLLAAVIGHWTALRGASSDALRGTFLTRPGKLSKRGDDDLLQVETQTFDILLDDLPWGIGTIRLPWMTRLLWVEWRN